MGHGRGSAPNLGVCSPGCAHLRERLDGGDGEDGLQRTRRDGGLMGGRDCAVGGGDQGGLTLQQLHDGADVGGHAGLQPADRHASGCAQDTAHCGAARPRASNWGAPPGSCCPPFPKVPVELLLEQVEARLHLGALASAHGWQRDAEGGMSWDGAAWQLLVLPAPALPPEAEDVGDPREGSWKGRCGGISMSLGTMPSRHIAGMQRGLHAQGPLPEHTQGCKDRGGAGEMGQSHSRRCRAEDGDLGGKRSHGVGGSGGSAEL